MNYCILGAARSGLAAARLATTINKIANSNSVVFVRELSTIENFSNVISEFDTLGVKYEFGPDSQTLAKAEQTLPGFDCLIISPGVPSDAVFVKQALALNIPVISELEFAWQHLKNPLIAITGTNGKTTTTTLLTYMFNTVGRKAIAAGNIGLPLADIANEILQNKMNNQKTDIDENTILVTEVSSYQLEFIDKFRPDIAVILNITPDHLKYHKTFENYINAKLKIAKNQTPNDVLILNADDEALNCKDITEFKKKNNIISNIYQISLSQAVRGIYRLDDKIINNIQQREEEIMQIQEIKIPGVHNQYNSMAAAVAANVWRLTNENLRDSLMQFQGVEHRLEFVRTIKGVDYINDSKATNVNATWYALSSYNAPIIWIAGGQGDNNDYSLLDNVVEKNVVKAILFGEEKEAIYNHYYKTLDCQKVETLFDAVKLANKIARSGDIVLFTPACKSFDQFLNYEQRGEVFKQTVNTLFVNVN